MKSLTLVSVVALAVGSSASVLQPRDVSNNNCGRAVAGTAKGPAFQSTAKADCSKNIIAYTTVVVTPSALTLTLTSNVQVTALATSIITSTGSVLVTSDVLSTETDQYVSTAYSTSTDVETLTLVETSKPPVVTETIEVTITLSPSTTVTSYYATLSPSGAAGLSTKAFAPREIQESEEEVSESADEEEDDCDIDPREIKVASSSTSSKSSSTIVPAKTTSPASVSGVPSYAAACTDFAQYAAACSLVGVYQTTSTISNVLPASTIMVTAFSTLTTTLLETSSTEIDLSYTTFETLVSTTTQSSTVVLSNAITSVVTAYSTQFASASTVTVQMTTTILAPTSTSTITAPVPNFKIVMTPTSGSGTTYYVNIIGSALGYTATTVINDATQFTLDTAGRLVTITNSSPVVACSYNSLANYYMEAIPYAYLDTHASTFTALKCSMSGTLQLICAYNAATTFEYVPSQNSFWYTTPSYYTSTYYPYVAHAVPI